MKGRRLLRRYLRQRKHRECEHLLSRENCSDCIPSPVTDSCQTISKIRDSFVNCTCGKLSHFFSRRLLFQILFWTSV